MTAEYLKTIEKVLLHLKAHPDAKEEDVESMSGIYWAEIRDYLKERRVVMYSGAQWYHVRTRFIDGCLDEIRIAKRKMAEEEKERKAERRGEMGRNIIVAVVASVIYGLLCFGAGIWWEQRTSDKKPGYKSEQTKNDAQQPLDTLHLR